MGPENWHEMLINFRVHNFFVCLSVGVSGENGWGVCVWEKQEGWVSGKNRRVG